MQRRRDSLARVHTMTLRRDHFRVPSPTSTIRTILLKSTLSTTSGRIGFHPKRDSHSKYFGLPTEARTPYWSFAPPVNTGRVVGR